MAAGPLKLVLRRQRELARRAVVDLAAGEVEGRLSEKSSGCKELIHYLKAGFTLNFILMSRIGRGSMVAIVCNVDFQPGNLY